MHAMSFREHLVTVDLIEDTFVCIIFLEMKAIRDFTISQVLEKCF